MGIDIRTLALAVAIVVGAALLNGLKVVGKNIKEVKLVSSGAGAAALAARTGRMPA